MSEIAEALADALLMFWQALNDNQRRYVLLGVLWVGALAVWLPVEKRRREAEEARMVDAVAHRVLELSRGR